MKQKKITVLLANGEFPKSQKNLDLLKSADEVICCDGAAEKLLTFGRIPDRVIGDLDSLSDEFKDRLADRIVFFDEQETNDLAKAFRTIEKDSNELVLLGTTGLRDDHALANISLLADFAKVHPNIHLETDYGSFRAIMQSGTFSSRPGQQISIFSFDPNVPIVSKGLKYPLNGLKLRRWWTASLNEALGSEFELIFQSSEPLLLYFSDLADNGQRDIVSS